jgi:hypothetical protein
MWWSRPWSGSCDRSRAGSVSSIPSQAASARQSSAASTRRRCAVMPVGSLGEALAIRAGHRNASKRARRSAISRARRSFGREAGQLEDDQVADQDQSRFDRGVEPVGEPGDTTIAGPGPGSGVEEHRSIESRRLSVGHGAQELVPSAPGPGALQRRRGRLLVNVGGERRCRARAGINLFRSSPCPRACPMAHFAPICLHHQITKIPGNAGLS